MIVSTSCDDASRHVPTDRHRGWQRPHPQGHVDPRRDRRIPPTVVAPISQLFYQATVGSTTMPVRTTWSATDSQRNRLVHARAEPQRRGVVGPEPAHPDSDLHDPVTDVRVELPVRQPGDRRCRKRERLGVRADVQDLIGAGDGADVRGSWTSSRVAPHRGGLKYTVAKGASAQYSFTGRSVSWVTTEARQAARPRSTSTAPAGRRSTCTRPTTVARQIVYALNWAANGAHTIRIVCLGTTGHPRVDVDAFVRLVQT